MTHHISTFFPLNGVETLLTAQFVEEFPFQSREGKKRTGQSLLVTHVSIEASSQNNLLFYGGSTDKEAVRLCTSVVTLLKAASAKFRAAWPEDPRL